MTLQWLAVDLVTGEVRGDLASFTPDLPFRHTLSNYDTATGKLYLDGVAPDWTLTVRPGATVLAAYDDEDSTRAIPWAGYVNTTTPDTAADAVTLALVTLEGYLARRYVPDVTYTAGTRRDDVIADMVERWVATGIGEIPGVPIQVVQIGASTVTLPADKVLQNTDNATVFDRITALCAELGGEFSLEWAWAPDMQHLVPTLFVGDKIGLTSPTGVPAVTFEQPGPVVSVDMPTDYSDGAGANVITAYSSGDGTVTPYSDPATVSDPAGRPVFEYRWQPVPNETDTTALGRYATQALAVLGPGAQPLSLVLALGDLGVGRQVGVDWALGDDVGYHVEPCPAFQHGLDGTARVIAIELGAADGGDGTNPTTVTPIFAQPEVYTEADS